MNKFTSEISRHLSVMLAGAEGWNGHSTAEYLIKRYALIENGMYHAVLDCGCQCDNCGLKTTEFESIDELIKGIKPFYCFAGGKAHRRQALPVIRDVKSDIVREYDEFQAYCDAMDSE